MAYTKYLQSKLTQWQKTRRPEYVTVHSAKYGKDTDLD